MYSHMYKERFGKARFRKWFLDFLRNLCDYYFIVTMLLISNEMPCDQYGEMVFIFHALAVCDHVNIGIDARGVRPELFILLESK